MKNSTHNFKLFFGIIIKIFIAIMIGLAAIFGRKLIEPKNKPENKIGTNK